MLKCGNSLVLVSHISSKPAWRAWSSETSDKAEDLTFFCLTHAVSLEALLSCLCVLRLNFEDACFVFYFVFLNFSIPPTPFH